jgi:hypothetical protein
MWVSSTGVIVTVAAATAAVIYLLRVAAKGVKQCLAFFERLETVVQNVEKQLYANGSSTLRDQTNRIEDVQTVMSGRIELIEQRLAVIEQKETPSP